MGSFLFPLDSIGRLADEVAIEAPATLVVRDVVALEQMAGLERVGVALQIEEAGTTAVPA